MIHQSPGDLYAIRMQDGWKFINGLGSGGFTAPRKMEPVPGGPTGQLYQMKNDSLESFNLFLKHPEIVKKLQKQLNDQINIVSKEYLK